MRYRLEEEGGRVRSVRRWGGRGAGGSGLKVAVAGRLEEVGGLEEAGGLEEVGSLGLGSLGGGSHTFVGRGPAGGRVASGRRGNLGGIEVVGAPAERRKRLDVKWVRGGTAKNMWS